MNRLRIQYGNLHAFHYSDRPQGGVEVEISIPYRDVAADNDRSESLRQNVTAPDSSGRVNQRFFPPLIPPEEGVEIEEPCKTDQ
jgi:hypothetical protein